MSTKHWSAASRRGVLAASLAAPLAAGLTGTAHAEPAPGRKRGRVRADHHLRSTLENLHFGGFPINTTPGLVIASGETVKIDTLSSVGMTDPEVSPEEYFAAFGVEADDVLPAGKAFWESLPDRIANNQAYGGPHIMTGPVYVEDAEPGDTIAIDILELETLVPYGVNFTGPTTGVMAEHYPGRRDGDHDLDIPAEYPDDAPAGLWPDVREHLYRVGCQRGREVVFFDDGVTIPTHKFMGVMGVASPEGVFVGLTEDAPPPESGVQISTPPGPFGGNLDVRDLVEGSTLYLPVFQPGAQVYLGDPHSCQGDGEVSGTAIEHSLAGTFRFRLVKGAETELPWAEDEDHWIVMGIHWDLDRAMRMSVEKTVDFLVTTQAMTPAKAYSFASIAVNYHASEVVDRTQVVSGYIPKAVFTD